MIEGIERILLSDIIKKLKLEPVNLSENSLQTGVLNIMASDLMSDVLMVGYDVELLVTSLATDQAIRTAHIMDMTGVIIVNGKEITESMTELSRELGINLFSSGLTKYDACCLLYDMQKGRD